MILDRMEQDNNSQDGFNLDELKESLLTHICTENKAFFKSQQIDDPELNYDDRMAIALELLRQSHSKFLQRFGNNMKVEHLKFFESQTYNSVEREEVFDNLRAISYNLTHHDSIVRNRRYAALLKLIKDKKYFNEGEMKSRDPLLYEQLIGQYQTPEEKRANRRPDATTDTLVDVLLEGIDHDFNREVEKQQRNEEEVMLQNDDESQESVEVPEPTDDDEDSESNHEQWGNFDQPETRTAVPASKVKKRPVKLITAGERSLLKEEFLGIMYSNFLSGKDAEFFDYTNVDDNEEYDDTLETDQDCEDKYFEDDSEESPAPPVIREESEEDDELDIYMKHLTKHLKQQESSFQEEFDD